MHIETMQPDFISNAEAAAMVGVTPGTLAVWRCTKKVRVPHFRIGRKVVYSRAALAKWLATRMVDAVEAA